MHFPVTLKTRISRTGEYVSIARYPVSGYYEITRDNAARTLFDSGREAWAEFRRNR